MGWPGVTHIAAKDFTPVIERALALPAFITPNVWDILVEKFNIAPITTPDEDLKAILG